MGHNDLMENEKVTLSEFLIRERKRRKWSKRMLTQLVGVSEKTIYNWEKSLAEPRPDEFHRLAKAFGMTAEQLNSITASESALDNNIHPYNEMSIPEIPTFDMAVAAGPWTEIADPGETHDERQMVHGIFRIKIRGDSMEKIWPDGSTVEFRCLLQAGLLQDGDKLEIGKSYYVQRMEDATFKRLEDITDTQFIFRAINKKKYPNKIIVNRDEVVRMAKAVGVFYSPE